MKSKTTRTECGALPALLLLPSQIPRSRSRGIRNNRGTTSFRRNRSRRSGHIRRKRNLRPASFRWRITVADVHHVFPGAVTLFLPNGNIFSVAGRGFAVVVTGAEFVASPRVAEVATACEIAADGIPDEF